MTEKYTGIQWRTLDIRLAVLPLSFLLSLISVALAPWPNQDSYIYIRTAEIFLDEGLSAAFAYYPWATYSVLIALLHQGLGIGLFNAAHVLNALFYAALAFAFISLVSEIRDDRRLSVLAAICILVYPQLNEYRYYLIRDSAFWALSLLALWQLTLFMRRDSISHGLSFCLITVVAVAFRPEGLAFLFMAPFCLLCRRRDNRRQGLLGFARLQLLSLTLLAGAFIFLLALNINAASKFAELFDVYRPFLLQMLELLKDNPDELGVAIFSEHASNYSGQYLLLFLLSGLLSILLLKLITGLGGPWLIVLAYGLKKRCCRLPAHVGYPVLFYLIAAFMILLAFVLITRFMTTRYTILFCLLISLLIPVIIDEAWERARIAGRMRGLRIALGLLFLYCTIDAYISLGGSDKNYVGDAVEWIASSQPGGQPMFTNSRHVAYWTGLVPDYDRVTEDVQRAEILEAPDGSLLVYVLDPETRELLSREEVTAGLTLLRGFPEDDPSLVVYLKP